MQGFYIVLYIIETNNSCIITYASLFFSGGNLYKRERKKRRRKLSERISESLEAKRVCESPHAEPEPAPDLEESSEPYSSGAEEDVVPIPLSDTIKRRLEHDYKLINQENKVRKLDVFQTEILYLLIIWIY